MAEDLDREDILKSILGARHPSIEETEKMAVISNRFEQVRARRKIWSLVTAISFLAFVFFLGVWVFEANPRSATSFIICFLVFLTSLTANMTTSSK